MKFRRFGHRKYKDIGGWKTKEDGTRAVTAWRRGGKWSARLVEVKRSEYPWHVYVCKLK